MTMAFLRNMLYPVLVATFVFHAVADNSADNSSDTPPIALAKLPTEVLKPLTPIVGTKLFLNTLYKMHDRTKPGCYGTWFYEWYEDWDDQQYPGLEIVCNKDDRQWYNTLDASWIFVRTEGSESDAEYDRPVRIRNLGRWLSLETWLSAGNWWVGLGGYSGNPAEDMWWVRSDPNNRDNLQLEIQSWWLNQVPYGNHRNYVNLKKDDPAGYPYSFVPAIDLDARMYNFVFDRPLDEEIARHTSKKDLIDSYDINNDSPASLSRTITVSEKTTDEFSYGFSESYKIFSKVSGSVGIPYLADGKVEAGFEFTVTANQNWKHTVEKLFSLSYLVSVPAHTNVRISAWYELVKGISMNYTAVTEITGKITRVSVYDDLVNDSSATGEIIMKHLEYSQFDGKIVEIKDNSVVVQIKGAMVVSAGVRGQLNVDGKSVSMQISPPCHVDKTSKKPSIKHTCA